MGYPITAIILTLNEEANIRPCLECLDWIDDLVIVDSGSRDGTLALAAEARKDVRIMSHPFKDFGDQRNWALDFSNPKYEWVLFVDADERITAECSEAIRRAVENPGSCVGFYLSSRSFFLGRWIKHCTLYPSWQLRLLKIGHVRFRKEGHGQREVSEGPLGYVRKPYDHYGFSKGISDWIDRHNVYSGEEVELIERVRSEPLEIKDLFAGPVERRRCLKRIAARAGCRPFLRFVYMYVIRGGILDGRAGWHFCLLRVAHEIHITAKLAEARRAQEE
jgi:glycosyltransferase involved in cell wall biosynthesis